MSASNTMNGTGISSRPNNVKSVCTECGDAMTSYSFCWDQPVSCESCEQVLCTRCADKRPLIPFDASHPETCNDLGANSFVRTYCQRCFEQHSTLDFQRTWEVVVPTKNRPPESAPTRRKQRAEPPNPRATVVMIHGGGATRCIFRPHAQYLADNYGYTCVLLDLPGHGSLCNKPLSLETCKRTVESVVLDYRQEYCNNQKLGPTVLLGGSLGAYLSFYLLHEFKDRDFFDKAVLLDCGQNVGPGASWKAVVGLWALKAATRNMTNKSLMKAMVDVTKKSPADSFLVESTFGAGMFFDQGPQQCEILETIEPARYLPALQNIPILYMNGSEDYRDSEHRWLELSSKDSQLHVYEGGDHFFSHDSRFYFDMMQRIGKFVKEV